MAWFKTHSPKPAPVTVWSQIPCFDPQKADHQDAVEAVFDGARKIADLGKRRRYLRAGIKGEKSDDYPYRDEAFTIQSGRSTDYDLGGDSVIWVGVKYKEVHVLDASRTLRYSPSKGGDYVQSGIRSYAKLFLAGAWID